MGHKVNPDIFRLGATKTWSFQLRTNKNFIKNLFIFKFLRNLFMNYTIPFFDFKKRRNQKFNDRLFLRGEEQIIPSPFVKNNLLFSHVYFGLIKNKLYIESFFIDVAFKQERKRIEVVKKSPFRDYVDYKPWNSFFYKTSVLNVLRHQEKYIQEKLKKAFTNRKFRFTAHRSKTFKIKPIKRLSRDFFLFLKNFSPKYHRSLRRYLDLSFTIKRFRKNLRIRKKIRGSFFFLQRYKILKKRRIKYKKQIIFFHKTSFYARKIKKINKKLSFFLGMRYFKKKFHTNFKVTLRYKKRLDVPEYKKLTLPKMMYLSSKSFFTSNEMLVMKKSFPKNPLYFFDFVEERNFTFYKSYHNLKVLKYFVRIMKYVKYFGIKKKIFFTQTLISLLMNLFGMSNTTILIKKCYVLLQSLVFSTFCYSFCNFIHFKRKFYYRYIFFKGVSKTVFRTMIELTNYDKVNFSVVGQNKFRFNSSLVLNYILIKLGQYFNIHEIVNPLSYYMKGLNSIAGYRILITGRLTRKERAAVLVRSGKRMPLSTIKANIDYSSGFKIMKFGLVGIKVYLLLNPSTLINLYRFQFNYN